MVLCCQSFVDVSPYLDLGSDCFSSRSLHTFYFFKSLDHLVNASGTIAADD